MVKHYISEQQHAKVMYDCLNFVKGKGYILKGGTALMLFHNLGRFSEDLDFDVRSTRGITPILRKYCELRGFTLAVKKDTADRYRAHVHYAEGCYFKFEVSLATYDISKAQNFNGILVYSVPYIADMKLETLKGRSKIRDIYDIMGIYYKYGLTQKQIRDLINTITRLWGVDYVLHHLDFSSDEILPPESAKMLEQYVLKFLEEHHLL